MQPMQLHWAPRLKGPRSMLFVQIVHFGQILLVFENSVETVCTPHCYQTRLSFEQTMNFL